MGLGTSKKWGNGAVFAKVVKFVCDRLKQGMASSKGLFFSAIAASTIDPLVAGLNGTRIVVVLAAVSMGKRLFCPHFDHKSDEV